MGRRPPSEPGVMHLTTAAAVQMRAGRTDTRSAPEQPEAARHRPKTSDSVATLSRLASSRLVSSRLVSCHTTLRPYDPRVLPSSVPSCPNDPRVLSSSVTSFDPRISPHPRLVCLAPSQHRVFSVLCSLISSRSKPRLPDRAAVWAAALSRAAPPLPPLSFYETIQGIDHSAAGRSGRTPARQWRPAPSSG